MFYPRGGSSQVVRYLVPALVAAGWPVALVAGSLGAPGDRRHAESFFKHAPLTSVAYDDAVRAHAQGRDPHSEPVPMHPSFEDRPGAPDRVFASLAPESATTSCGPGPASYARLGGGAIGHAPSPPDTHPRRGHGAVPGHAAGDPPARDGDPDAGADRPPVARSPACSGPTWPGWPGAAGRLGGRRGLEPGRTAPDRRDAMGMLGARRALVPAPARRGGEVGPRGRHLASPP